MKSLKRFFKILFMMFCLLVGLLWLNRSAMQMIQQPDHGVSNQWFFGGLVILLITILVFTNKLGGGQK